MVTTLERVVLGPVTIPYGKGCRTAVTWKNLGEAGTRDLCSFFGHYNPTTGVFTKDGPFSKVVGVYIGKGATLTTNVDIPAAWCQSYPGSWDNLVLVGPPGFSTLADADDNLGTVDAVIFEGKPFDWRKYDRDGNGCIDTSEMAEAAKDYFDGLITKEQLLECQSHACECTPGETKCEGYNLYRCNSAGRWYLAETNSPSCGYTPPPPPPPPFDPWVYDLDKNGCIDRAELTQATKDYFDGLITKEQLMAVDALPKCPE